MNTAGSAFRPELKQCPISQVSPGDLLLVPSSNGAALAISTFFVDDSDRVPALAVLEAGSGIPGPYLEEVKDKYGVLVIQTPWHIESSLESHSVRSVRRSELNNHAGAICFVGESKFIVLTVPQSTPQEPSKAVFLDLNTYESKAARLIQIKNEPLVCGTWNIRLHGFEKPLRSIEAASWALPDV